MGDQEGVVVKKSFFKNVKSEFKKITFLKKDELIKRTGLVVIISVLLGVIISLIDAGIKFGMDRILGV